MKTFTFFCLSFLFSSVIAFAQKSIAGSPAYMYPLSLNEKKPCEYSYDRDLAALKAEALDRKSQSSTVWVVYWVGPSIGKIKFMDAFYVADINVNEKTVKLVEYDPNALIVKGAKSKPDFATRAVEAGIYPISNILFTYAPRANNINLSFRVISVREDSRCPGGTLDVRTDKSVRYYSGPSIRSQILEEHPAEVAPLFVYAYDKNEGMYLVATSEKLSADARVGRLLVKGWIPKSEVVTWDNALVIEPTKSKILKAYCRADAANNPGSSDLPIWIAPKLDGQDSVMDPDMFRPIYLERNGDIVTVGTVQHKVKNFCNSSATIGEFYNQVQERLSKMNIVIVYEKSATNAVYIAEVGRVIEEIASIKASLNADINVGLVSYGNKKSKEVRRFDIAADLSNAISYVQLEGKSAELGAIRTEGADIKGGIEAALTMFQSNKESAMNFMIVIGGLGDFELSNDESAMDKIADQLYAASVYCSYFGQTYSSDERTGEILSFIEISKRIAKRLAALNASFLPIECRKNNLKACENLVSESKNESSSFPYFDEIYTTDYNRIECRIMIDDMLTVNIFNSWASNAVENMVKNVTSLLTQLHDNPCWFEQTTPCTSSTPHECLLASLSDIYRKGYIKFNCSSAKFSVFMTGRQLDLIHSKLSAIDCSTCSASDKRKLVDQLMKDLCSLLIGKIGGDVCCDYTTIGLLAGLLNVTESDIRQCILIQQPFFNRNICDFANAKTTTDIEINEVSSYFAKSFTMMSNVKNQQKMHSFQRNRETYWWVPLEALFPDTN